MEPRVHVCEPFCIRGREKEEKQCNRADLGVPGVLSKRLANFSLFQLPEMLHGDGDNEEHGFCPVGQFILQNLGLLFGFAIMLVIALYEDKIVFDIQF